jgi:hypothetical protein
MVYQQRRKQTQKHHQRKGQQQQQSDTAAAAALDEAAATDLTVTKAGVQHQRTNQNHTMHEDHSAASSQFSDGQLVWPKCSKHPHWPARISGVLNEKSVKVEFFPDETAGFAEVHPSQIASCDMGGGLRKVQQAETE